MCIGDVTPISNLVDSATILADHCVTNVSKLPVLKDQEVMLVGNSLQLSSDAVIPPAGIDVSRTKTLVCKANSSGKAEPGLG